MSNKTLAALGAAYEPKKINSKMATSFIRNVRLTFVYLDRPNPVGLDDNKKTFSVTCMIPKSKFAAIQKAVQKDLEMMLKVSTVLTDAKDRQAALVQALAFNKERSLFKDGDKMTNKDGIPYEYLQGHALLQAKLNATKDETDKWKPKFEIPIVDIDNNKVAPHRIADMFYSGVWADVMISFAPYSFMGKGITTYLNGVQKIGDDEKFGGSSPFSARDDLPRDSYETEFTGMDEESFEEQPKAKKKK